MIEFEESTGNVYADLVHDNADEMLVKAQLATKIAWPSSAGTCRSWSAQLVAAPRRGAWPWCSQRNSSFFDSATQHYL